MIKIRMSSLNICEVVFDHYRGLVNNKKCTFSAQVINISIKGSGLPFNDLDVRMIKINKFVGLWPGKRKYFCVELLL